MLSRRRLLAAVGGVAVTNLTASCRLLPGDRGADPSPTALPAVPAYAPIPGEVFPKAKATAARFVEALLTYGRDEPTGASIDRALTLATPALDRALLASRAAPVVLAGASSTAQVVYPQLGGLVPLGKSATYAVVMVVTRHRLLTSDGERRTATRTIDVRLRVAGGTWAVEELGSVGGDPTARPRSLPAAARRLLDDPRVTLPDSARWDLYDGRIDGRVLDVMSELADRTAYSVTVIRNGHPRQVVDGFGDRASNHFLGRAVDVWALDDVPVVQQRTRRDSRAFAMLEQVITPGPADEVGVPVGWDLDGPVRQLFDNAVHNDHFHLAFRRAAP